MKKENAEKVKQINDICTEWDKSNDPSVNKKIDSLLAMALKWSSAGGGKAKEYKALQSAHKSVLSTIENYKKAGIPTERLEGDLQDVEGRLKVLDYKPVPRKKKDK